MYIQTVLIEFVAGQINGSFILFPRKGNCPLQQDAGQPLSSGLLIQIQLVQKQTILFRLRTTESDHSTLLISQKIGMVLLLDCFFQCRIALEFLNHIINLFL